MLTDVLAAHMQAQGTVQMSSSTAQTSRRTKLCRHFAPFNPTTSKYVLFVNYTSFVLEHHSSLLVRISGVPFINRWASCVQERVVTIYNTLLANPIKRSLYNALAAGAAFGAGSGFIFWVFALGFWYGGQLIESGEMTLSNTLKVPCPWLHA